MLFSEREEKLILAESANRINRHDDAVRFCKLLIDDNPKLTEKECSVLNYVYKDIVNDRRQTISIVDKMLTDDKLATFPNRQDQLQSFRVRLLKELDDYCFEIIQIIDTKLIPADSSVDFQLFCYITKGDYFRYSTTFKLGEEKERIAGFANSSYQMALKIINDNNVSINNPKYLGLTLNYSVFLHDVLQKKNEAIAFTIPKYKESQEKAQLLDDESFFEICSILHLMRDNLVLWTELETW